MRTLLSSAVLLLLTSLPLGALAAGDGLRMDGQRDPWAQWQWRVSPMDSATPVSSFGLGSYLPLGAARWSGDHFFDWARTGQVGGLRATGAVLLAPNSNTLSANPFYVPTWRMSAAQAGGATPEVDPTSAAAYFGLGYSARWDKLGLGFSADVGLVSQRPNQILRLGRDSADALWHGLQLNPMLQVHLSYAF